MAARAASVACHQRTRRPGTTLAGFLLAVARLPLCVLRRFRQGIRQLLDAELVCLAGFMRLLSAHFTREFPERILNIHPSLLPCFPGLAAWKQALDHGVKITGCTVHFVDAGVDSGPIIAQQTVPVLVDDTPETLHQRIQAAEHELYPAVLAGLARGEISVKGRRVICRSSAG